MSQSICQSTGAESTRVLVKAPDELPFVRRVETRHAALSHAPNRLSFHVINGVAYPQEGVDVDLVIAFLVAARAHSHFEDASEMVN